MLGVRCQTRARSHTAIDLWILRLLLQNMNPILYESKSYFPEVDSNLPLHMSLGSCTCSGKGHLKVLTPFTSWILTHEDTRSTDWSSTSGINCPAKRQTKMLWCCLTCAIETNFFSCSHNGFNTTPHTTSLSVKVSPVE